ncbi:hypothetical protein DBA29_22590 [Xenophilus aerolatus]|nr:hypothetical protein [Xenophilus aerolatus]
MLPTANLTPFEMAIVLIKAGVETPPYPRPLKDAGALDSPILLAAHIHQCDAWEFHVTCLYEARREELPGALRS